MKLFHMTLVVALLFEFSASAGGGPKKKSPYKPPPGFRIPTPGFEVPTYDDAQYIENEADWETPDDEGDEENNNRINTPRPPSKRAKVRAEALAEHHARVARADERVPDFSDEEELLTEDENGNEWDFIHAIPLPTGIDARENVFFSAGSP